MADEMNQADNSRVSLRPPVEKDWSAILKIIQAASPWMEKGNLEWLQNRKKFDDHFAHRRHYVMEESPKQHLVAYGGVEEGPETGVYRVFIVMSPERLVEGLGQFLYDHLKQDLKELQARGEWVSEEVRATILLDFFKKQGFSETTRTVLPDGVESILMENKFQTTARAG